MPTDTPYREKDGEFRSQWGIVLSVMISPFAGLLFVVVVYFELCSASIRPSPPTRADDRFMAVCPRLDDYYSQRLITLLELVPFSSAPHDQRSFLVLHTQRLGRFLLADNEGVDQVE